MQALRRICTAFWLTALPLAAGPLHAAGQELTPDEMRAAAAAMVQSGRTETALGMTQALLGRDPDDVQALLIRSRALRDSGDTGGARDAARRVLALADGDRALVHAASLAMAQAWSTDGHRTLAQVWLRRAAENAPDEAARAQAERDYRYVRSRNRWSTRLAFSVAPKSNVNNGSVHDSAQLYGLPFQLALPGATQALSGLEIAGGGTLRYRMAETRTRATDFVIAGWHQTYVLSDAAKAKAPGSKGSDFATTTLSLGLDHRFLLENGRSEVSLGARAGRHWLGGSHYGDFVRGTTGLRYRLDPARSMTVGLSAERTGGPRAPHATAIEVTASFSQQVQTGLVQLSIGAMDSSSSIDVADYRQIKLGLDYVHGRPVLGTELRAGIDWRLRDYPVSSFAPGQGREDTEVSGYVDVAFPQVDYYGFNPTVTVRASRQDSSVGLFDIDRLGVQLGFRSAF
ncbi:hypothetical protein ATO6_08595 [Oceanicola sp. 22II-s10i]|uniref:tetratricopeptide repeat protein n=1 Tax=Oceanicola sp. 22II-s10i TaxID=1317116 RepID=UPI000B526266|nr:tetratricopeptide repeat protein [Oceanicola sp. 22II-s10i]OWU85095.1 hypothetical protein ATO6_08595 [Oceanicola sp. 22II-s10i]